MGRLFFLVVITLLASCVDDIHVEPAFEHRCGRVESVSVQDIREALGGGALYIDDDIVVEVTVIANDYYNNFFKKVVLSDQTGGFELLLGMYDAHLQFPIGRTIHISMKGLTADLYNEVMRVGISDFSLVVEPPGDINYYYILDEYVCDCLYFPEVKEPVPVSISELSSDMCGRLVTVKDIINNRYGITWASTGREYVYFQDSSGTEIVVETSSYAQFASELVPIDEVAITGVLSLQNINEELFYTLKIGNLYDVSIK